MMFQSTSDADTMEIGRKLGKSLKPGDVVCLYGDLGAGKTTMVKGIASTQGIDERDITSASYTIIAEYETDTPFYHIDLYRINQNEASDLGLDEYLNSNGISVIEWAERLGGDTPDKIVRVEIKHVEENSRSIEIQGIEL